jgi:predicted GNAT family acetyltransferase
MSSCRGRRHAIQRSSSRQPAVSCAPARSSTTCSDDHRAAAFLAELGSTSIQDVPAQVADRLEYCGLVLWEVDGVPVSMAGRTQALAGICKVAPVYTPPQQRTHGYGTAATRHAVDTGAPEVLLFTDATNPVTNSIYQRLGYRPAEDRLVLTFT